MKQVVRSSKR